MKVITLCMFLLYSLNAYGQAKMTDGDLKLILGNWEGSITYLDYQTNNPFTMPANLNVRQGKKENILLLDNIYPKEPKANHSDKIKISKNGTVLNKNLVTDRKELGKGQIQIQTEREAKDDKKRALIRYTYTLGDNVFIIRKEVQFEKTANWIKRSEYRYRKKQ